MACDALKERGQSEGLSLRADPLRKHQSQNQYEAGRMSSRFCLKPLIYYSTGNTARGGNNGFQLGFLLFAHYVAEEEHHMPC